MQWQIGSRVLANWTHDEFWYPGTVQEISGERLYIHYDDGGKEWTTGDRVLKNDIEVGDWVQCMWKKGPYYYTGRVAQMQGDEVYIHYDDGGKEWTTISCIRVTR